MSDSPKTWNPEHKTDVALVAEAICCGRKGCAFDGGSGCMAEDNHGVEAVQAVSNLRKHHRLITS